MAALRTCELGGVRTSPLPIQCSRVLVAILDGRKIAGKKTATKPTTKNPQQARLGPRPRTHLLVITEPSASSTATDAKFSLAISSMLHTCVLEKVERREQQVTRPQGNGERVQTRAARVKGRGKRLTRLP